MFLSHLRSLELSFNNPNDHLYLSRVYPTDPVDDESNSNPDNDENSDNDASSTGGVILLQPTTQSQSQSQPHRHRHVSPISWYVPGPGPEVEGAAPVQVGGGLSQKQKFGYALWADVMRGVREGCPNLRGLDVLIGGGWRWGGC